MAKKEYIGKIPYFYTPNGGISDLTKAYLKGNSWVSPYKEYIKAFDENPFNSLPENSALLLLGIKNKNILQKLFSSKFTSEHILQKHWFEKIKDDQIDLFYWVTTQDYSTLDSFVKNVALIINHEAIKKIRHGEMIKTLSEWAKSPVALTLMREGFLPSFKEIPALKNLQVDLLDKHVDLVRELISGVLPIPFHQRLAARVPAFATVRRRPLSTIGIDGELFLIVCNHVVENLESSQDASY